MTVTLTDLDYEDWTDTESYSTYKKAEPHVVLWEVVSRSVHNQLAALMDKTPDENFEGLQNLKINGVNVLGHVYVSIDDQDPECSNPMRSMVTITLQGNIEPFETLTVQF